MYLCIMYNVYVISIHTSLIPTTLRCVGSCFTLHPSLIYDPLKSKVACLSGALWLH